MSHEYAAQAKHAYGEVRTIADRLSNLRVAVPLWFAMFFLWLNGAFWWPEAWESGTANAYILLFTFTITVGLALKQKFWFYESSVTTGFMNCLIGFVVMFAGLLVLDAYVFNGSLSGPLLSSTAWYPAVFITAVFVAPVEETMFRGVMPEFFKGWKLGVFPVVMVVTAAAFAVTHMMVYRGQVMSLWWAFIMGCVFFAMTRYKLVAGKPLGVPASIGAHTCYNLFVLGALTGGMG